MSRARAAILAAALLVSTPAFAHSDEVAYLVLMGEGAVIMLLGGFIWLFGAYRTARVVGGLGLLLALVALGFFVAEKLEKPAPPEPRHDVHGEPLS